MLTCAKKINDCMHLDRIFPYIAKQFETPNSFQLTKEEQDKVNDQFRRQCAAYSIIVTFGFIFRLSLLLWFETRFMGTRFYPTSESKTMILMTIITLLITEIWILYVDHKYKKNWFYYSKTKLNYAWTLLLLY